MPAGRLKLREQDGTGELIYYVRPDGERPRRCDYEIIAVESPVALKRVLSKALGVRAIVRKLRTLFLHGNVRIHLDDVEGLGTFIEFEAVMPQGVPDSAGEATILELMHTFGVMEKDLVPASYCDHCDNR